MLYALFYIIIVTADVAEDDIKALTGNRLAQLFTRLCNGKMRQEVCYTKYGVVFVLADRNFYLSSVRKSRNAVNRKRHCRPLILFDSAVVMRFKERKTAVLIQGIRL